MPPPNCERLGVPGYEIIDAARATHLTKEGPRDAFVYTTAEQGEWIILQPPTEQRIRTQNIPSLNGASHKLYDLQEPVQRAKRQESNPPSVQSKNSDPILEAHQATIHFFTTNWPKVAQGVFYIEQQEDSEEEVELQAFNELDVEKYTARVPKMKPPGKDILGEEIQVCGRVDFLGEGPDGQMVLIEFSKPKGARQRGKSKQIGKQLPAIKDVIQRENHGEVPPIHPFIGRFRTTETKGYFNPQRVVDLHQPVNFYSFPLVESQSVA